MNPTPAVTSLQAKFLGRNFQSLRGTIAKTVARIRKSQHHKIQWVFYMDLRNKIENLKTRVRVTLIFRLKTGW